MRSWLVAIVGLLAACASAPPAWTPAARTSAATCTAPDAPTSASWQLVTGQGFTYCVPGDWHSADGRTWQSGGSVLGWCTRDHFDQCPQVHGEITFTVIRDPSQMLAAGMYNEGGACSGDRYTETASGGLGHLFDNYCNGHHMTGAVWEAQSLYFFGQTDDAITARLEVQVYRTVRFVTGPDH